MLPRRPVHQQALEYLADRHLEVSPHRLEGPGRFRAKECTDLAPAPFFNPLAHPNLTLFLFLSTGSFPLR